MISGTAVLAERLDAARAALAKGGLGDCRARAAGVEGEVLLLRPSESAEARLWSDAGGELLALLHSLGFRYIAVDLAAEAERA